MNCKATGGSNSQAGGGIWMGGGRVTGCDMFGCTTTRAGSGVYMSGGELHACHVFNNSGGWGAAVFMDAGASVMVNCLVTGNTGTAGGTTYGGGGGVRMSHAGARILNSTICNNRASDEGGGVKCVSGVISNSIIFYNKLTASGADDNIGGTTGTNHVRFSCSPDLAHDPSGTGNITDDPGFADLANNDFTLGGASPCIDAGAPLTDVVDDLVGQPRPQDGDGQNGAAHDMGCYEALDAALGPLSVNFLAPLTSGGPELDAVFTAAATGEDSGTLFCWWDYDMNGTPDATGWNRLVVTNLYSAPGRYSVSLTVSNLSGVVTAVSKIDYITVLAATTYVATNGPHVYPFTSSETAASNIQEAVDATMEGGTVQVAAGIYRLNEQLNLTRGVAVRSAAGAGTTIIDRNTAIRLIGLGHADAVLDGFTLRNGSSGDIGGNVNMTAGLLANCVLTNGAAKYGGGVYMTGGVVSNCLIASCSVSDQSGGGIHMTGGRVLCTEITACYARRAAMAVYMTGGELERCVIRHNSYEPFSWGAALWVAGAATARNCLVAGNLGGFTEGYGDGGGVLMNHAAARLENCTVVGNRTMGSGGGVKLTAGTVTNCIVYGNSATVAGNDFLLPATPWVGFSCSPDLVNDPFGTGNRSGSPQFVDPGSGVGLDHVLGDYHVLKNSPCIDTGHLLSGLEEGLDLSGGPRLLNQGIDIGAYETWVPPAGTIMILR
jgi:PKD repeat protein